jgi:hypothetical protein
MLADRVVEGRGPTDTVAAGNFECDTCSDNYDIRISLYIINTLWARLSGRWDIIPLEHPLSRHNISYLASLAHTSQG